MSPLSKTRVKLMSELNKRTDSIGMHVFSLDLPGGAAIAHCRNFAPLHVIYLRKECFHPA
jgi:hypothetical protein